MTESEWVEKIRSGDRVALSRAITLCESNNREKQEQGFAILNEAYSYSGNSIRIGISGTPGAGKSTFIESFGLYLIEKGHKVAVLAVDPSSSLSKGSILGDKTRMDKLSVHPQAFIRPSPSGNMLGGLSARTAESIILCETAGYDFILVETVGVGQSEVLVKDVSDVFILIAQPGAGDELQGIKRGIMEITDLILVNKDDGALASSAGLTYRQIKNAMGLFPPAFHGIPKSILRISALNHKGMDKVYDSVQAFIKKSKEGGFLDKWRNQSEETRFMSYSKDFAWEWIQKQKDFKNAVEQAMKQIKNKETYAYKAARAIFQNKSDI